MAHSLEPGLQSNGSLAQEPPLRASLTSIHFATTNDTSCGSTSNSRMLHEPLSKYSSLARLGFPYRAE